MIRINIFFKHLPCNANNKQKIKFLGSLCLYFTNNAIPTNVNNQGFFKKFLYNYIGCYKYTSDFYSIVYMFVLAVTRWYSKLIIFLNTLNLLPCFFYSSIVYDCVGQGYFVALLWVNYKTYRSVIILLAKA